MRIASNADGERIEALVYSVLKEYGLPPEPDGMDADLRDIETHYLQRGGVFWVIVQEDEQIIGTVGLSPLKESVVELRKMYLAPEARGQGLGKRLLTQAIDEARRLGFRRIELDTASRLEVAIRLYRSFGFQEIVCHHIGSRCDQAFALDL
jgi:putative acetyltransferase